ncbi:unnamed protein product [Dicrocoelium dendriticum]|nr:unnamed protein product [Dicrocoelium dendriticum]
MSASPVTDSSSSAAPSIGGLRPSYSDEGLTQAFQIDETAHWVKRNSFQRIGLQFPDYLLHVAAKVCHRLSELTQRFCFILADTSYSSCCVDEIAGKRLHIDALVHYGHACLSNLSGKLPVLFVYVQRHPELMGISETIRRITKTVHDQLLSRDAQQPLVITYDFDYQNVAHALCIQLQTISRQSASSGRSWPIIWSEPELPSHSESIGASPFAASLPTVIFRRCGRAFHCVGENPSPPVPPWSLIHVGRCGSEETFHGLSFYRILLSFPEVDFTHTFHYDTYSHEVGASEDSIRRLLRRRTYLIEKAKDAQCVGILIGTLSVRDYLDIVERLQRLLKCAGRLCITLAVGRLIPEKLANLPELDLLVIVGCPECSLLDSRDILVPVITPFELECALSDVASRFHAIDNTAPHRLWTGAKLWVDFSDLLPASSSLMTTSWLRIHANLGARTQHGR